MRPLSVCGAAGVYFGPVVDGTLGWYYEAPSGGRVTWDSSHPGADISMPAATEAIPFHVIVVTVPFQMAFGYTVERDSANAILSARVCYLGQVPFYQALIE